MESTKGMRKYRHLTAAERMAIRVQYEAGARQVDLAAAFQVTQATISRTVSRRQEAA